MAQPREPLDISCTDKVKIFLDEKKITDPKFVINFEYASTAAAGGGGCLCAGGGMPSTTGPQCKIEIVDNFVPGKSFILTQTKTGIPTYIAKPLYDIALKVKSPMKIDTKGAYVKTLQVEGLDLSSLIEDTRQSSPPPAAPGQGGLCCAGPPPPR